MKNINIEYLEKIIEAGKTEKMTAKSISELLGIPRTRAETYGAIYSNKQELAEALSQFKKIVPVTDSMDVSAWNYEEGRYYTPQEYCDKFGIDFNSVNTWRLSKDNVYTFTFKKITAEEIENDFNELEEIKSILEKSLKNTNYDHKCGVSKTGKTGVVKLADLHFGAYVDNLIKTKKFSINILAEYLSKTADEINAKGYRLVHIHLLGDLIESFTGLSHKNTWKGLDKAMVGADAIKLATQILHDNLLNRINNLGEVKIVAGNHDRVTSDNKEDVQGGGAQLISWGLELMGYSVEFNPIAITHIVDGICHILTHGHHGISKKSTQYIVLNYGKQGMFNLICEGHLHSIIEKLSERQKESYQTTKDDAVDHRRFNCPSYFTGNFYSESLGYTSQGGFVITEDNGNGVPNVFYYAL